MTCFTIEQVKRANEAAGYHWFSPGARRFFKSRTGRTVYPGGYFVSSEQGPGMSRAYTVRKAMPNGKIETIGEFQAYKTARQAVAAIRRLA